MSAVQAGNGQQIHHAQHNGQQGEDIDKTEPIPGGREDLPDGDETAHRLIGLRRRIENEFQVVDIAADGGESEFETSRNGFPETILAGFKRRHRRINAQQTGRIHLQQHAERVRGQGAALRLIGRSRAGPSHIAGFDFLPFVTLQQAPGLLNVLNGMPVQRDNPVPAAQVAAIVGRDGRNGIHHEGQGQAEHTATLQDLGQAGLIQIEGQGILATHHRRRLGAFPGHLHLQTVKIADFLPVEPDDVVARLEAHIDSQVIRPDAGVVAVAEVTAPPRGQDDDIQTDGKNKIEQHAAGHHQQALPGRFGAKFPRLGFGLQVLRIHRLVHHS